MGNGFASFATGFGKGFLAARQARQQREQDALSLQMQREQQAFENQMAVQAQDLAERQHQFELKKHDVQLSEKFLNVMGAAGEHPAAREFILDRMAGEMGIDVKGERYRSVKRLLIKLPEEQRRDMVQGFIALNPQLPPGQVTQIVRGMLAGEVDPIEIGKMLMGAARQAQRSTVPPLGGAGQMPAAQPQMPSGPSLTDPTPIEQFQPMEQPPAAGIDAQPGQRTFEDMTIADWRREALRLSNAAQEFADDKDFAVRLESQRDFALEMAQQLQEGEIAGRPQIGTIPPGFQVVQDPETGAFTMQEIPGGPVASERQALQRGQLRLGGFVLRDARFIQEAIPQMADNPLVRLGQSKIPGTAEYEVQQDILSLQGSIGVDSLLEIKRQGSGLGQVPQTQLDLLSRLMGQLSITRDKRRIAELVRDIQETYLDVLALIPPEERAQLGVAEREFDALRELWGGDDASSGAASDPDIDALLDKYGD